MQSHGYRIVPVNPRYASGGGEMIRMSVGIEHIDDILWDIDQALHAAGR